MGNKEEDTKYPFAKALNIFLVEINGLWVSLPIVMKSIGESHRESSEAVHNYLKEKGELLEKTNDEQKNNGSNKVEYYKMSVDYFYELNHLRNKSVNFMAASAVIPKSFVVAMISQFDAYLGRLIRAMYYEKPEMLNASEKQLTFADIVRFGSIETAREFILEREIESVLRESHVDHFGWLEKKLGIPLRKGLDVWPDFVELTERRNLFVHSDGIISTQYIDVCEKQGVSFENKCTVGEKLKVSREYFQKSYEVLFEVSTKLAQVMWRKLVPTELEMADSHLNSVCYDLLKQENYNLAKKILSFASSLPKHHSQETKLIFVVNSAIAYKWGGAPEQATRVISETDWSACRDKFQLAVAALMEDFDTAGKLMRRIGQNGEVKKADYKDWPVFKDFRQSPQFLQAYKEVFGEYFETIKVMEKTQADEKGETIISIADDDSTVSEENLSV